MTTAVLFPGQGAETPRMGLDLAARSARCRELLEIASRACGVDVIRALTRGERALGDTAVLQPTLVAVCLGAWSELTRAGLVPACVAGHSLGELSAWCAAGGVSPEEAVTLAATRGRLMAEEARRTPGGMVALHGGGDVGVARAVELGSARGVAVIAARNAPDETVIAGDVPAMDAVLRAFSATRLSVSGAWHSPRMRGAREPFVRALESVAAGPLSVPWVSGVTGALVERGEEVPALLANALVQPVRWVEVMETLGARGVTRAIIAGPGKALRALVRRNLGVAFVVQCVETHEDLERALAHEPHLTGRVTPWNVENS